MIYVKTVNKPTHILVLSIERTFCNKKGTPKSSDVMDAGFRSLLRPKDMVFEVSIPTFYSFPS